LIWRINIRLQGSTSASSIVEAGRNRRGDGGIVITKRQVTRIEEAACLVLLMMGCIWILVVLGGAGDWKLSSYRLAWFRLSSSLVFVQYKPIPRFQAFTKFNAFSCPRYQHLAPPTDSSGGNGNIYQFRPHLLLLSVLPLSNNGGGILVT
jgi:hypothetical protein